MPKFVMVFEHLPSGRRHEKRLCRADEDRFPDTPTQDELLAYAQIYLAHGDSACPQWEPRSKREEWRVSLEGVPNINEQWLSRGVFPNPIVWFEESYFWMYTKLSKGFFDTVLGCKI